MTKIYWKLYRAFMRTAHKYDWHYAPLKGPILPDFSMQRWCQWCGFRETYKPHYRYNKKLRTIEKSFAQEAKHGS